MMKNLSVLFLLALGAVISSPSSACDIRLGLIHDLDHLEAIYEGFQDPLLDDTSVIAKIHEFDVVSRQFDSTVYYVQPLESIGIDELVFEKELLVIKANLTRRKTKNPDTWVYLASKIPNSIHGDSPLRRAFNLLRSIDIALGYGRSDGAFELPTMMRDYLRAADWSFRLDPDFEWDGDTAVFRQFNHTKALGAVKRVEMLAQNVCELHALIRDHKESPDWKTIVDFVNSEVFNRIPPKIRLYYIKKSKVLILPTQEWDQAEFQFRSYED